MRLRSGAPRLRTLSNPLQDAAVHESMGAIVDRTREQLGSSDAMIMRVRRRLLAAATALRQRGETPPGVEESACPISRPSPGSGADWVGGTRACREALDP
jgi:phthalate 4,5-dioxygenase